MTEQIIIEKLDIIIDLLAVLLGGFVSVALLWMMKP